MNPVPLSRRDSVIPLCTSKIDKMKKNFYLAVFPCMILWTLSMISCSGSLSDDGIIPVPGNRVEWEMVLNASASRAVINPDGSGTFVPGDTIVIRTRDLNDGRELYHTLHLSDGKWIPEIRWEEIGKEVEFTAWHLSPACRLHQASLTSSDYSHAVTVDQQKNGYGGSDLLCAATRVRSGEKVRLCFNHALSRLHVVLESRDASYSDTVLQQAEVQILTPCQLLFRLTDGTLLVPSDDQWIIPVKGANHTWTALLCPQKSASMPTEGWIRIRIDGQETTVKVPETLGGKPFEGLEAGAELTYRLNLQRSETSDPFAGVTRWVYGVREPSDDQWNYDHTQLAWRQGCGWFDCNKVDPSDITSRGDGLMCWAAATSNLIHWWLEQNRETAAVQAYDGPQSVPTDMLHSAVFQLYKMHFPNQGNYPLKAINWFFNGVFHKKLYDTDPVDPVAGFFREQLGSHTLGAEYVGTDLKRDRFNALIKQALNARQGIVFVVNLGKVWNTHAVTLWGAKFNADGLIETLYMVDNNDGRSDPRGTIRTMEVRYQPYSESNPDLYPYVPNSVGDFTVRIESLCTLSLGREWIR